MNLAKEFVRSSRVSADTLRSVAFMETELKKAGYYLHRFDDENDELALEMDVSDLCRQYQAFTVNTLHFKCVFVKSDIMDVEAARLILHELGHIKLDHINGKVTATEQQELAADEFADTVRQLVKAKPDLLRIVMVTGTFVVILIAGISSFLHAGKEAAHSEAVKAVMITEAERTTAEVSEPDAEMCVYITKSGKKYHAADCYHIKNSAVFQLTAAEAEQAGYERCKDCFDN